MDAILEYINRNIKLCVPGRDWLEQQIALNRNALDVYMSCEQPDWLIYIFRECEVLSAIEARALSHHIKAVIREFCTSEEFDDYLIKLAGDFNTMPDMRLIVGQTNTHSANWTLSRLEDIINAALFAVINSSQERQERLQKLFCIIIRNEVPFQKVSQACQTMMWVSELHHFTLIAWESALERARSSKILK